MTPTLAARLPSLALAPALAFAFFAAQAATVTVTVKGADGQPAANVVVQAFPAHAVAPHPASAPVVIAQKDIHFEPTVTAVPVGTTVRFSNLDDFDHHIRSQPGGPLGTIPPAKEFEFRLKAMDGDKVSSADVKLDKPGVIVLGCHLHGSMRGDLFVADTPFVAVTDAKGRAVLAGVPDGAVELRAWHPEQLIDQPALSKEVAGKDLAVDEVLNFTPPKSRGHRS